MWKNRGLLIGVAALGVACTSEDPEAVDVDDFELELELPAPSRLQPPEPYVLAPDGQTRWNLEEAGLVRPRGRAFALALGKILFWEQQAGSDGNACASCHFAAGADLRITNQLTPGHGDTELGSTASETGEVAPGAMPSGATARVNYTLTPEDFPLHVLEDKRDRNSPMRTTTNDAISSQGSFDQVFRRVRAHGKPDDCEPNGGPGRVRQVEPRNTPTTVNAAFFLLSFWDGRASSIFNGFGVHGMRDVHGDPDRRLIVWKHGVARLAHLEVHNASLASQSVGPPLSATEMSCAGRTFPDVGRKLLATRPLRHQKVAKTDSILGKLASHHGDGLRPNVSYRALIQRAFPKEYWGAPGRWRIVDGQLVADPRGYTQMEINFSMFWGLAIMLYERTLISDQSRFDDWFESCRPLVTNPDGGGSQLVPIANPTVTCRPAPDNSNQSLDPVDHGFTAQEALGFGLFNNGGVGIRNPGSPACSGCHPVTNPVATPLVFPTFSEAAFQHGQTFVPVERSRIDDPGSPLPFAIEGGSHDRGFFSLGLRPASTDLGNGGVDPYGNPLSIARMFVREQAGLPVPEPSGIANRCNTPTLVEPGGTPPYPGCPSDAPVPLDPTTERFLVDGTFKTPSIRNVGLTPPYFHYGGYSTLRSVVEVYARGGSKRDVDLLQPGANGDWSGTGRLGGGIHDGTSYGTNVDFFIRDIRSTDEQIDALVAFMLTTTDPRVQCDMAPFDHPELVITNGHDAATCQGGDAPDITFSLPAVGADGYRGYHAKLCIPNAGNLFASGMEHRRGGD